MSGKRSEKTYKVKIPEFTQNELLLSDIEIASNILFKNEIHIDSVFMKDDLVIIPYPFYHISTQQPVYFYFEISNLMFDDTGYTSYEVKYNIRSAKNTLFQKLNSIRRRISLSSSFHRKGIKRNAQEYFSIDFKNLLPREYILTIQVTDELSSEKVKTDVRFKLK